MDNLNSEEYLYHCVSVIENDQNISHDTLVIMFVEYGRKLLSENNPWIDIHKQRPPDITGRYEVHRFKKGSFQLEYEIWECSNGNWNWRDSLYITHWRYIKSPLQR